MLFNKDAVVRSELTKTVFHKPWEYASLPSASGLCHTIDGFFDAADVVVALGKGVPGRCVAVYYLTWFKLPLEIGGDEILSSHAEVEAGSDRGEETKR